MIKSGLNGAKDDVKDDAKDDAHSIEIKEAMSDYEANKKTDSYFVTLQQSLLQKN